MADHAQGPGADEARGESEDERLDRNWNELLQEMRVTQTGVQILTGFLLTLPFQQKFAQLDDFQVDTYLTAVLLSAGATALIVAPVSFHRILFRRRQKAHLVRAADLLTRTGLVVLATAVTCVVLLVFDVVLSRGAALVVAGSVLAGFVVLWLLLPLATIRRHRQS